MSSAVENLRNLPGEQPVRRIALFTVVGASSNPTEVIVNDGTADLTIPCLDGYRHRLTGDQVVAMQLSGNDWIVLGKISADDSPVVAIAQGNGPPPTGFWRETAGLWVADHMDGRRSLYLDMTGAAPAPVIVEATDAITWDGSDPTRDTIDVDGTRLAAWYYNGGIAAACGANTVNAMYLRITRAEDGGPDRPVPLKLGMHGGLIAAPLATNFWEPGLMLSRGQAVWVHIPALYLSVLADGTVGGFVAYAEDDDSTMRFEPTADLQIHFG